MRICEDEYDLSFCFKTKTPPFGEELHEKREYEKCQYCGCAIVDPQYKKILEKLKTHDLLDKNYPLICCDCWLRLAFFGDVHCPECGELIEYEWIEDEELHFICAFCHFRDYQKIPPGTLKKNMIFDPKEEIERRLK